MRIGNRLDYDPIAILTIGICDADAKPVLTQVLDARVKVAMRVMEERLTVRNEKLEITNLGTVERRIVNFADNAVGNREPYRTRSRVGGADDVLRAMRPARRYSRSPGRHRGV